MEIINKLKTDANSEVVEAIEQCDYQLLYFKKKSKEDERQLMELDAEKEELESQLGSREMKVLHFIF